MRQDYEIPALIRIDRASGNQYEEGQAISLLMEYTIEKLLVPNDELVVGKSYKSVIRVCAVDDQLPELGYNPFRYEGFANYSGENWDYIDGGKCLATIVPLIEGKTRLTYLQELWPCYQDEEQKIKEFMKRLSEKGVPYE